MDDVKAVKWLPLKQAVETLSRPHEKVFLTHVGPIALGHVKKTPRGKSRQSRKRQAANAARRRGTGGAGRACDRDGLRKARPNLFVKTLGNWIGRVAHGRRGAEPQGRLSFVRT